MKKVNRINIIFILCFLIMITAPLLFINKVNGKISSSENRYLASFPNIVDVTTGSFNRSFPSEFKNWFNDNIGFRERIVELNNYINVNAFNEINNKLMVIGKENWLFLMNDTLKDDIQHKNILNEEKIEFYQEKYSEITNHFNELGTNFAITVFPHKINMYSEYLPSNILQTEQGSLLDQVRENFQNNNKFDLNVVDKELREAKQEKLIYSKTHDSSHWNNYGAFIGYTELMKQAKKYIPNLKILNYSDFNIEPYEVNTEIEKKIFVTETDYKFEPKFDRKAISNKGFFNNIAYKTKDPWKSYNYFKNSDDSLPKAIVVGDSYVWMFMLENMAESFSELAFIHQLDIDNLNLIYSVIKPDIILGAGLDNTMLGLTDYSPDKEFNSAEIVLNTTPTEIKRDEKYDIEITVKNTSNSTWSNQGNVKLCIFQDGQDFGYRVNIPDGVEVNPDEEYTFTLKDFQAPPNDSTYLEYQMLVEGVEYFGEKERVDVKVIK